MNQIKLNKWLNDHTIYSSGNLFSVPLVLLEVLMILNLNSFVVLYLRITNFARHRTAFEQSSSFMFCRTKLIMTLQIEVGNDEILCFIHLCMLGQVIHTTGEEYRTRSSDLFFQKCALSSIPKWSQSNFSERINVHNFEMCFLCFGQYRK